MVTGRILDCLSCDEFVDLDDQDQEPSSISKKNGWVEMVPPDNGPEVSVCPNCDLIEVLKSKYDSCVKCGSNIEIVSVKGVKVGFTDYGNRAVREIYCYGCEELKTDSFELVGEF